ncbi:HNH endonuclease signature motif containing protein [Streptomyces sp. NPDC048507]|uniref:HNH endonuclease signature motif containing protein n=1 Tax=Streptomyces sp. NPDC048507 TaxID=3365560 RepID=UPI00371E495E
MSDFNPGARLCKILFGRATGCAYPDCSEPLIEEHRGLQSVNVEVAHIRAEKPGGARYDPDFNKDNGKVNSEENLMLLCTKHHKWVDDHKDAYPTEELLDWKARQVTESRSAGLSSEQLDYVVTVFTTPRAQVRAVGVIRVREENIVTSLASLPTLAFPNDAPEETFLGVTVTNVGVVGFDMGRVGLDFDFGGPHPYSYAFPSTDYPAPPRRLEAQGYGVWRADIPTVREGVLEVAKLYRIVPTRFRAFAAFGAASTDHGPWEPIINLPFWPEHVTQEYLEELSRGVGEQRAERARLSTE